MKRPPRRIGLGPLLAVASCAAPPPAREAENVVWIEQPPPAPLTSAPARETERGRVATVPRDGPEPHHFWTLDVGEVTERREWVRVDRSTWEERYPSGAVNRYRILGRLREAGRVGMIARRVPDAGVDVFIPDLGAEAWPATRVAPDGDWHDLGPMHTAE